MKRLTTNQLMILLDVDRGTFTESRHLGTQSEDIKLLQRRGLIRGNSARDFTTTSLGEDLVCNIKTLTDNFNTYSAVS